MGRASIGVTTVTDSGSMHVRAWPVTPELAASYAALWTGLLGEPEEMISDLETMQARGQAAEAAGAAVFRLPDEEGGGDA